MSYLFNLAIATQKQAFTSATPLLTNHSGFIKVLLKIRRTPAPLKFHNACNKLEITQN